MSQNTIVESRLLGKQNLPNVVTSYEDSIENGLGCVVREDDRIMFRKLHDRKMLLESFEKGRQTFSLEYQLRLMDSHIIWASNTTNLYRDPLTGDIYLYEYCFDTFQKKISER